MSRSLLFLLFLFVQATRAEPVERFSKETTISFAQRIAPKNSVLAHKPVEARAWSERYPSLLLFYESPVGDSNDGMTNIQGLLFLQKTDGRYDQLQVDHFDPEGGNPKIESIFFESVAGYSSKILFIIVSWEQNHAVLKGRLYETFTYAAPGPGQGKLTYLEALSDKFSGGCECWRLDEPATKARFKTASDVRAVLRR
ncbi:hypothetical protein [Herbaspirillum seropedicae]|uniref:hypothetical protein n=1 Tax=Herbaspirillum seropedicae TaxID=964 RepID=UPI003D99CC05